MYWDDEYALEEYGREDWDLWSELAEAVSLWSDTYLDYWGLEGRARPDHISERVHEFAKSGHHLAPQLLDFALRLTPRLGAQGLKREELKTLRQALRAESKSIVIRDRVSILLADQVLKQLKSSLERALRLLSLVGAQPIGSRASEYVRRAARLYVWGFDPECIVMCRSALEAALQERLVGFYDEDSAAPSLDALIRIAGENDVLDGFERTRDGWRARQNTMLWEAQRIKWSGNYAVHDQPSLRQEHGDLPDSFHAIRSLTRLLGHLFPADV